MFDSVLGLPMHPLVVHGVVVLLPLMATLSLLVAARSPWRQRWAWPVVVGNLAVTAMAFAAKQSGEALARRLDGLDIATHAGWGKMVAWSAVGLLVATGLLALTRRSAQGRMVGILVTLAGAAAILLTIRAGHTGAEAVWGSTISG